jgi:hypothetical protein
MEGGIPSKDERVRGGHFAACEVANRSIDFLAHLPRHPLSFTLLPAASNVYLLKEK